LRRLAMGLDSVRSSRVPSFATGSAIVGGGLRPPPPPPPPPLSLLLEWWAGAIDGDGTGGESWSRMGFDSVRWRNTTPVKRNRTERNGLC
jgi:hypothetical protein